MISLNRSEPTNALAHLLSALLHEHNREYALAEKALRTAEALLVIQQRVSASDSDASSNLGVQSPSTWRALLQTVYLHLARVLVCQHDYAKALEVIETSHLAVQQNSSGDRSTAVDMVTVVQDQQKVTSDALTLASVLTLKGLSTSLIASQQQPPNAKRIADGIATCERAIETLVSAQRTCHPRQTDALQANMRQAVSVTARVCFTVNEWVRGQATLLTHGYVVVQCIQLTRLSRIGYIQIPVIGTICYSLCVKRSVCFISIDRVCGCGLRRLTSVSGDFRRTLISGVCWCAVN